MAFPTTGILDTFTRTDSPTTLGTNWTIDSDTGTWGDLMGISSNYAYNPTNNNGAIDYWNVSTFSGTLEAFVTIHTLNGVGNASGVVFSTGIGSTNNGYTINVGGGQVVVYRGIDGTYTSIKTITQANTAGDSVGATLVKATGVITVYYKVGAGAWTNIGTVTDTTYSCSYIGLLDGDSTARLSNFGGGTQGGVSFTPKIREELTPMGTRIGTRQLHDYQKT